MSISMSRRSARWLFGASLLTPALIFSLSYGCGGDSSNTTSTGLPGNSRATLAQAQRGRYLVLSSGCTDCHNRGKDDPSDPKWLAGYTPGTAGQPFVIGPFNTYPANLTPDAATGIGNFTARQIYNSLKFGLTPDTAPDAVITSTTPGQGNLPATPHYLAPPMPWTATRHWSDDDIWATVAYLKQGIKAVSNTVPDSQGPPDFWAGSYADAAVGPTVVPAYPASNEQFTP